MTIRTRTSLRAALVVLAALGGWWNTANAQSTLTPAGTSIQNRATVNYSVGGQPQTLIESSPSGNATPGLAAGANTTFLVDNRVDLTVAESGGAATITAPGAVNPWLAFTVTNTGNAPQGYQLTIAEEIGGLLFGNTDNDDFGLVNLQVLVDEDPSLGQGTGNGLFDGTETATAVDVLEPGYAITVFVVSPSVPLALVNGDFANVRLEARTAVLGAATLVAASGGVNDPLTVEILFADAGNDATESALDQFAIQSAALSVTKTQEVLDDGFGSASPRAIPNAVVEYTIAVVNTSTTTAAGGIAISDPIPGTTTFLTAVYGANDVAITNGGAPGCIAEMTTDDNGDGCFRNGVNLVIGGTALGSIAASSTLTVQFQVRIN